MDDTPRSEALSSSDVPDSMAPPPSVSVICSWYNRADFIADTLEGLLSQTHPSYEVIVFNDGSPDPRVREVLESYDDPRLRIVHQDNTGLTVALARAVEMARAPYIAVQDAGDVSLPERLVKQQALLDSDPELVAVGVWFENALVREDCSRVPISVHRPLTTRFTQVDAMTNNPLSHGEVMFRRDIYDKVGGYRTLFARSQDRDLWLRMTEFGEIGIVPETLYDRRIFAREGIATSMSARSQQAAFAAFAVQCLDDRKRYGADLLAEFGDNALLFRKRSGKLGKQLAMFSILLALQGDETRARLYSDLALRERKVPWPLLSWLFVRITAARAIPENLRKGFQQRVAAHPAFQKRLQRFR